MQACSDTDFTLSFDPIKEIPFGNYQKDFTFVVNGKKYLTNRFNADFLSPLIRKLHFTDETINNFYINTHVNSNCDFFEILSLTLFQPKKIKRENLEYFINIFFALGNKKEFLNLLPKCKEGITITNAFEMINIKQEYFHLFSLNAHKNYQLKNEDKHFSALINENELINGEIDFISSHFYEIDLEKVKMLDPYLIEIIINHPKLKLADEDSLFRFIMVLYSKNKEFGFLFEYIHFMSMSKEEISRFSDIFEIEDLNGRIWRSLIERTVKSKVFSQYSKTT